MLTIQVTAVVCSWMTGSDQLAAAPVEHRLSYGLSLLQLRLTFDVSRSANRQSPLSLMVSTPVLGSTAEGKWGK